jgi:hypothetical protein
MDKAKDGHVDNKPRAGVETINPITWTGDHVAVRS